jgi:hypothetical protein
MTDKLLDHDHANDFKTVIHLAVFGLSATCFFYNLMAWLQRREGHLLRNTVAYGAITVFEGEQIRGHMQ